MIFINDEEYKNKIGIYKITNKINQKIYIGKTQDRFIERFWNHSWKLNKNLHDNKYLQHSWNKYGKENFEFEIVEVCSMSDDINLLEEKYIKLYDSYNNGYNLTFGGEGTKGNTPSEDVKKIVGNKNRIHNLGKRHTKETKLKMSKSHKGLVKSKEHRENLSKSLKGRLISEDTKQKLKEINTGSNSPVTTLDENDVFKIKERIMNKENQKNIADAYNISLGAVSAIANNRTWNHVIIEGWDEYMKSKKKKKKLTIDHIKEIKKMLKKGFNCSEIARQYNVYPSTISGIKTGKYHKDV